MSEAQIDVSALTKRQRQILAEILTGDSYKVIARRVGVTDKTVKRHAETIRAVMKMPSRSKLIAVAAKARHDKLTTALLDIAEGRTINVRSAAYHILHELKSNPFN